MHKLWLLVVWSVLLVSCSPGGMNGPLPVSSSQPPTYPTDIPVPTVSTVQATATVIASQSLGPLSVGGVTVRVPDGWFSSKVQSDQMEGIIFANQKPAGAFQAGLASGALVLSPMPESAVPAEFIAGMTQNLSNYTDEDFSSLLLPADQIGLIDLRALDSITLDDVKISELSGSPALVMYGTLQTLDNGGREVHAEVDLSWAGRRFVTFYRLAAEDISQPDYQILDEISSSIQIPGD